MMLKPDYKPPEYIKCSDLAKIGYPYTYEVLERGLEAIGWRYDINTDRWYPPLDLQKTRNILTAFLE